MGMEGGAVQVTQTPQKPHQAPSRARLVGGRALIVIAVALTALTGYSAYDYATGVYEGADAAVRMFLLLVTAVLALFAGSVGLLMVLSDKAKARRWIRMVLVGVLVLAVLGALVLMSLAAG